MAHSRNGLVYYKSTIAIHTMDCTVNFMNKFTALYTAHVDDAEALRCCNKYSVKHGNQQNIVP